MEAFIKKLAAFERARREDFEEQGVRRYQFCYWYQKLWRHRWTLMVLVWFLRRVGRKWSDGYPLHPKFVWSIARGTAHYKMKYYYTMDEVELYFEDKFRER